MYKEFKTVRFDRRMHEGIKKYAEANGLKDSSVVRMAVARFLRTEGAEVKNEKQTRTR